MDKKTLSTTACCTLFFTIKLILWWWWMCSMYHFSKTSELCSESSLSEWLFSSISIVWRAPCQSRSSNIQRGSAKRVSPPRSRIGFLSAVIATPSATARQSFWGLLMSTLEINPNLPGVFCRLWLAGTVFFCCWLLVLLHCQTASQSLVLHPLNPVGSSGCARISPVEMETLTRPERQDNFKQLN